MYLNNSKTRSPLHTPPPPPPSFHHYSSSSSASASPSILFYSHFHPAELHSSSIIMPPNYADPADVPYFFSQLPHPRHDHHDHDHNHDHDHDHEHYDHDHVLLEGALLRHSDPFPYLFLVAMEAGSMPRALLLLLLLPISWLIATSGHRASAFNFLLFVAVSGLRIKDVEAVARAVLPRFLSEDVSATAWKKLCASQSHGWAGLGQRRRRGRLCVVTGWPRAFVEPFARYQLGAELVVGSELMVAPRTGRCIGLVRSSPPTLLPPPDQKLAHVSPDQDPAHGEEEGLADLPNPVVFHDGRLAQRPTPLLALLIFLWMPVGILLALFRLLICGHFVPFRWWLPAVRLSGINIIVKGKMPEEEEKEEEEEHGGGRLIVCNHRTLADPIMISIALGRPVTAVTYSLSRVSEMVAPISTVRLDRNAAADLKKLRHLVEKEGRTVVVCPEGTTGREPLLLRFSALFAEVTDRILPVAINTKVSLFHGTTVRGFKALDSFFFLMNPSPTYEIHFLEPLPRHATCGSGGVSRVDVANHVQRLIASSLGFRCSSFTRRDKYRFLVGSDGSVTPSMQTFSSVRS